MTTDGGGWTRVVNALPTPLPEIRSPMSVVKAGQGDPSKSENAWIGVDSWNALGVAGAAEMRCWGGVTGALSFRAAYSVGTDTNQALNWNVGCFGSYNQGYALSSSDMDRDAWSGDCVNYSGTYWAYEGHGWGWHQHCHCGSFWDGGNAVDGPGGPLCFGKDEACWSTVGCRSDQVEFYVR